MAQQNVDPTDQSSGFDDDIDWGEEELEPPTCDLSNPDICESCQ